MTLDMMFYLSKNKPMFDSESLLEILLKLALKIVVILPLTEFVRDFSYL